MVYFKMKERFAIIGIAVGIGLFTTSIAFLLFKQSMSGKPQLPNQDSPTENSQTTTIDNKDNKPPEGFFIQVDEPTDEAISDKRTIIIKGKTNPENTIISSSNQEETAGVPSKAGDFSLSLAIEAGLNVITTRAISPSGEEVIDTRTVTFSTEDF
jgi:hypothetical protein